jgi:adenylate kinase
MSGRRVHPASGRVYHVTFNPPRVDGKDDATGEPLIQRDDDREDTVRGRLEVYHRQTHPLVDFYQARTKRSSVRFARVDGLGEVKQIEERILRALQED